MVTLLVLESLLSVAWGSGLAATEELLLTARGILGVTKEVDSKNCGGWKHQQSPETQPPPPVRVLYRHSRTYVQELRLFVTLVDVKEHQG